MRAYCVKYYEYEGDKVNYEIVYTNTKEDAYETFMNNHNWSVYSAWVDNYTAQNGNVHYFKTMSGLAY